MKLLSEIFFGYWFLAPQWAEQVALPLIDQLQSKAITLEQLGQQMTPAKFELPQYISSRNILSEYKGSAASSGSVGVIRIQGSMMKEDFCGTPGMATMGGWIKQMNADPNISAIVLHIETPGGTANGTYDFADTIRNSAKPVVSFIEDMSASAGMWAVAASKEAYANNPMARVGSIGTYISFRDYRAMEEKNGIKTIEVYSRLSPKKNNSYREAMNGNTDPLKDELDVLTTMFHNSVKQDRGEKLNLETLKGDMYFAHDAVSFGLIDGILNFDATVERARALAADNKPKRTRQIS